MDASEVANESARILREFGKIGVLIDDAPLATNRVGRELYGVDQLPQWWVHHKTIDAGAAALRGVLRSGYTNCPTVVVVDALLPLTDTAPPRYWDRERGKEFEDFQRLVTEVYERKKATSNTWLIPITSYPRQDLESVLRLDWQHRFHEPLFQLRRSVAHAWKDGDEFSALLRFSPEEGAPVTKGEVLPDEAVARYRARTTRIEITEVARRLRDPEWEVVLLTGAGMSFASSLEQAGMPWNDQLLTEAARSTLEELTNGGPIKPPSPARMDCSIRKMLVQYSEKKRVCLKDLFDDERQFNSLFVDQPGDWDKKFRKNFQRAVMRYDEGFCYQHWLAAKLNFAFIVSTNFDGFHERAATHHAATLGTSWSVDVLRNKKIAKPYGTTFKRDEIAFSAVEFQNAVAEMDLSDYFSKKKDKQLEIVAVGHALRDQEIPLALSNMAGTRLAKLTWVVPEAQAELHGRGVDEYSRVRLFKTPRRKDIATAIPVRAIDFFYDLWEADRLLEKERRP